MVLHWTPGGATYMSETSFGHISETNKARDLRLGRDTPQGSEKKLVVLWTPGGATCMSETSFHHISETNKARDLRFGTHTPLLGH